MPRATVQMNYGTLVSTYDYPASLEIVKKDDRAAWPDNEYTCESCSTTLSRKGEIWLTGQISTCPRCLPLQLGTIHTIAEISGVDEHAELRYTVLVSADDWDGGYCVGLYATLAEAEFARLLLYHCKTL